MPEKHTQRKLVNWPFHASMRSQMRTIGWCCSDWQVRKGDNSISPILISTPILLSWTWRIGLRLFSCATFLHHFSQWIKQNLTDWAFQPYLWIRSRAFVYHGVGDPVSRRLLSSVFPFWNRTEIAFFNPIECACRLLCMLVSPITTHLTEFWKTISKLLFQFSASIIIKHLCGMEMNSGLLHSLSDRDSSILLIKCLINLDSHQLRNET